MPNKYFRFKHFTVWHDRCAMKVGTDGVLLGAWSPVTSGSANILDIGTGSGLIALMLAQRCPKADIDAIDIDCAAIEQARENFSASPWSGRLLARCISLQSFAKETDKRYELIVSNPPYFVDSLKNPDVRRQAARHTDTLDYSDLVYCASKLLSTSGTLALILPAEAREKMMYYAGESGLNVRQMTNVYSKPGKPVKRVLMSLSKGDAAKYTESDLYIESEDSPRSEAYSSLTEEFYL